MADYYNAPGPSGAPYAPPNSTMAIISLIAGVLGITFIPFIGSIAAVIFGSMAKKEIRESNGALAGDGLATAGLILGWIGIALGILSLCLIGAMFVVPFCLVLTAGTQSYWIAPLFFGLF